MEPIPQCHYVIRKGEKPDPGRSNILPWTPAVAMRPDDFEPYLDPMPPLNEKVAPEKVIPSAVELVERVREKTIINTIDHLEPEDFTAEGLPKLGAIKNLTGINVTAAERENALEKKAAEKKKKK